MNTNDLFAMRAAAGSPKPLPLYTCHKQVHALKIKAIEACDLKTNGELTRAGYLLKFDDGYVDIFVDLDFINKHNPKAGGYYVIYKDGYRSWSPAEAFEEGYTLDKTQIVR